MMIASEHAGAYHDCSEIWQRSSNT